MLTTYYEKNVPTNTSHHPAGLVLLFLIGSSILEKSSDGRNPWQWTIGGLLWKVLLLVVVGPEVGPVS